MIWSRRGWSVCLRQSEILITRKKRLFFILRNYVSQDSYIRQLRRQTARSMHHLILMFLSIQKTAKTDIRWRKHWRWMESGADDDRSGECSAVLEKAPDTFKQDGTGSIRPVPCGTSLSADCRKDGKDAKIHW